MQFNVETSINIQFTEEQIKAILAEVVHKEMPNVEVADIEWVIKRNPTSVSAKVDASMKGFEKPRSISETVEEAVEEVQETVTEAVEEVKNTVAGILDL